jgi:5-methylthioadenosine/S-adenosylhomocysteine deaminase
VTLSQPVAPIELKETTGMTTLLDNITYLALDASTVISDAAIVVDGATIAYAGPAEGLPTDDLSASRRIDCSGLLITPGLVNSHNHIYEILYRGLGKSCTTEDWLRNLVYPANRSLDPEDFYHGAVLAVAEAFSSGTTALVEQLTNFARHHADSEFRALLDCGIRARVARAASTSSVIDPSEEGAPDHELAAVEAFLNRWPREGLVQPRVGPSGLFSCDRDTLVGLKRLANEAGVMFHIHLSESLRQQQLAESNGYEGQISWAADIGILDPGTVVTHAIFATERELAILADSGASVVHCPASNMVTASGIADIPRMLELGIPVALGTDGPASNDTQDMVAEMKAAVLLHRGATMDIDALDAATAFTMATRNGGAMFEPGVGEIIAGGPADLAGFAFTDNPSIEPVYDPISSLVFTGSGRDTRLTMVAGEVVYDDGRFPTLDLTASLQHVRNVVVPKVTAAIGPAAWNLPATSGTPTRIRP